MRFLDILTLKRRRCDHTYVYLNKESVGASYGCDVLFHDEYYVKCLECGREVRCFSAEQVLRLVTKLDKKVITQTKQNVKEGYYMEIPKEIKDSIRKSAKAFHVARNHEKVVRDWLDEQVYGDDNVNDKWIDLIELGQGDDKGFIDFLKKY